MFSFLRKSKNPEQLFWHTDMHCHVVPGVDDGSPDVETSLELLERMASWGLTRIIATPHMTQDTFENTPDILDPALHELQMAAQKTLPSLDISRSCEHRVDDFFISQLEKGLILPFPGNYILVENSFAQEPWNIESILFDLKIKGYKPIMAHPERFLYYHRNRERYRHLHDAGNLFQINILSLAGHYGSSTKKVAEWMLSEGMVDFIGTDLHKHSHADAIEAYLCSRDYRRLRDSGIELMNDTAFPVDY